MDSSPSGRDANIPLLDIVDSVVAIARSLPVHSVAGVDLIDRGLLLLSTDPNHSPNTVKPLLEKVTQVELGHANWGETDRKRLVEGMNKHGNDIEEIADGIASKKMRDVVKRYYIFHG